MKFQCPQCGQHLAMETMHGGQSVNCPSCGANMIAPIQSPSPEVIQTLQSSIDRGNMTISQYMAQQQIEGAIDLQSTDDKSTASAILTAEQGRKYKLGEVVASGGMGAILDAKDVNLRRNVAMKVIIDPGQASKDQILRFIQEAQVTSQIEHPSIVPIYELGVDASGNVFYTMKFVHGRTLKDILVKISTRDADTIRDHPLSHLLNIFQKVCDAMAFAHSKRVIHRDLKPENIMVGDYGEVQVMDWGLAKVLPKKGRKAQSPKGTQEQNQKSIPGKAAIDSVRGDEVGDVLKTMDGSIMGTPGFMSPEQATGQTDEIDERTDIYALGAILYNILTLDVPVKAKNLADLIDKVTTGDIRKPTEYNEKVQSTKGTEAQSFEKGGLLPHMPDRRIPESLSAVAMKALEVEAHRRYQKVKDLQKEIEAYQGGFATGAEKAGTWKQLQLFVKRNKVLSIAALMVALAVSVGGIISTMQWLQAQKALADFKLEQKARTKDRKQSAPAMVRSAKMIAEQTDYEAADLLLQTALEYDPAIHEAYLLRALLLVHGSNYVQAVNVCQESAKTAPGNAEGKHLLDICRQLSEKERSDALLMKLSNICQEHGLPTLAATFALSPREKFNMYRLKLPKEFQGRLFLEPEGSLKLDLSNIAGLKDVTPFRGIPLTKLSLTKTGVTDLSPLKDMLLSELRISETQISNLMPLKGMPLKLLDIRFSKVSDLLPLKEMPLTWLDASYTEVKDLTPLKGLPLTWLEVRDTKVTDLAPLRGMALKWLSIHQDQVYDLAPLAGMPLTHLAMQQTRVTNLIPLKDAPLTYINLSMTQVVDLFPLRGMPLVYLNLNSTKVADLSPITGAPLKELNMSDTLINDLTPLKDMPLTSLSIASTKVTDLSPLKDMSLLEFRFTPKNISKGLETLRHIKTLKLISSSFSVNNCITPAEFWKKYDAGEFNK